MHPISPDPVDACTDPKLPWVAAALDTLNIERALALLPRLRRTAQVRRARLTRHKRHRRCAIEYDLVTNGGAWTEECTAIGRIRARHDGTEDFARMDALWSTDFGEDSEDGISVPEPIGAVPSLHMWLQYKVPGRPAGDVFSATAVGDLPERIAEAAHKIHVNSVPTARRHTLVDELSLLKSYLGDVTRDNPGWSRRIDHVLEHCQRLAATIDPATLATIHGDFYHDQVIVHDGQIYLVDFDLYSWGDPALDIGNFVAHLTELGLRTSGNPRLLAEFEARIVDRFLTLAGPDKRPAVSVYTTLSLARHIYLSVARPGRSATAEAVLELCEDRLGLASRA